MILNSEFLLSSALGWMTSSGVEIHFTENYLGLASHPGQLSLAISSWVGLNEYWQWSFAIIREEMASST